MVTALLVLRTWAIWGHSRRITIVLIIWASLNLIANFTVMGLFMTSIGCELSIPFRFISTSLSTSTLPLVTQLPDSLAGCLVTSGNSLITGVWTILMIYEAGKLRQRRNQVFL